MISTLLKQVLFLVCFCLAGMAKSEPADSPNVVSRSVTIEPKVLDFGKVNENEKQIELSFTIKNSSKHDISIVSVKTGCGCTSAKLPQSTLKPGVSISVPVDVNISGRRGIFEESARIEIAEYKDQILTVPIKGTVIHDIWFVQPMIWCPVKESETSVEIEFEVHTVDFPNVKFDLKLLEEALSITELERIKTDGQTTIKISLKISDIPIDQTRNNYRLVLLPYLS